MNEKTDISSQPVKPAEEAKQDNQDGYPSYPVGEDIYSRLKEEKDVNPEDISRDKVANEKDPQEGISAQDLDVPGSELDDDLENIGSEDEENNYYSLGGEAHHDLDEVN